MMEKCCEVAIIGGGPAGLSAARVSAEKGASVILIDDSHDLGGHFYKRLPEGFDGDLQKHDHKNIQELQARLAQLDHDRLQILDQTRVWGISEETGPTFQIYAEHPDHNTIVIQAQIIILAPGVYDRPLPFPGWELSGVITPGAAQMALKKQALLPGEKILVCGTGPLQMVATAAFVQEGAEVVAMLDTCGIFDGMRYLPGALGSLKDRFGEVFESVQVLIKNRVPIFFRQAAFRALGNQEIGVTGALIGKVDAEGHPIPGTERSLAVDTICCAYGFVPSIALTLHLGCKHIYEPNLAAHIPWHDQDMQTSQPGVFVAGDVTGIGGKSLADLQGALAGISALAKLGIMAPKAVAKARHSLAASVNREGRFSRWLWNRYRIREGLLDLVDDQTLVCRCENVTVGDIKQSLADGARNLYGVKLRTRQGMGSCQGRYCMMNTTLLISRQTGAPVHEAGMPSVRPPIIPTRLQNIASKE